MLQTEVLVLKLVAIDGLPSGSISSGEVSSLTHEVGDDAVEAGALVAEALLSSAQGTEVLSSLGDHVITELKWK